jgi:hypothetical protein
MKMFSLIIIGIAFILLQWATSASVSGQTNGSIPADLRPSLDARLASFLDAQKSGNWDLVTSLLGRYRGGETGGHLCTDESKACVLRQMQKFPMISFAVRDVEFSSEILNLPADMKWWYLAGDAVFRGGSRGQPSSNLVAYRDNVAWYFTPPNFDDYWERKFISESQVRADHANQFEAESPLDAPLEIVELHAFINRESHSLWNVKFKVRNQSTKKIKAFVVMLSSADGGITIESMPEEIDPAGVFSATMSSSRYLYSCDGPTKRKLLVDTVVFDDGSEWQRALQSPNRIVPTRFSAFTPGTARTKGQLFVAQRPNRADEHHATRRNVGVQQRHYDQQASHGGPT